MANANSTTTTRSLVRTPIKVKVKACEVMPAYSTSNGVLSFRHGLQARESNLIDKALEIVGGCLRKPGAALASPDAVKQYLRLHLAGECREVFAVLFLDIQNRVTAFEIMFVGTLAQTNVYPREVVLAALAHGAASVIFAHNHPGGGLQPSQADDGLTRTLINALALVDVWVLDHIIVSNLGALSMLDQGLMPVKSANGRVSLTA